VVLPSLHFLFQAEDGIRDRNVTGVQTCALPIYIAMKVIKELKLSNYHIAGEIESGVPYGYFSDNDFSGIPIITKAGAFGSKYVLKNSLVFIKNLTKEY